MKPVVPHMRQMSMRVVICLDDLILFANSECIAGFRPNLFHRLGLVVNREKSHLVPPMDQVSRPFVEHSDHNFGIARMPKN